MDQSTLSPTSPTSTSPPTTNIPWEHLKIWTYDHILAGVFILGTVVGVFGNSCAICFFWPRRKKTIHDLLYLAICTVDLITVLSSFPVIASLLNDRRPMLFGDSLFCDLWTALVILIIEMAIFLAMIICVTRTMIMKYPMRPINRSWIIGAIIGYLIACVLIDVLFFGQGWTKPKFWATSSACWISFHVKIPNSSFYLGHVLQLIKFLVPSLITLICFVVGIRILKKKPVLNRKNVEGFHRASVTISIFTAVFLFFNAANFVIVLWSALRIFGLPSDNELFKRDDGRKYYFHLTLQILPMFLNAVVNPVLYALRMKEYHDWNQESLRSSLRRLSDFATSLTGIRSL